MKYIVEFEDKPCMYEDEVHFYKCIQAPWWGLSEKVIKRLTPYQPDHTADVSKKVERTDETAQNVSDSDLVSRKAAIEALDEQIEQCNKALGSFDISPKDEYAIKVERASLEAYKEQLENMSSAQPTLCGYNIEHLILIANVLRKENLPPERVVEALTDIGRIVSIVKDEFEESLRKAVEQCKV